MFNVMACNRALNFRMSVVVTEREVENNLKPAKPITIVGLCDCIFCIACCMSKVVAVEHACVF
jgi:hypothetical protein